MVVHHKNVEVNTFDIEDPNAPVSMKRSATSVIDDMMARSALHAKLVFQAPVRVDSRPPQSLTNLVQHELMRARQEKKFPGLKIPWAMKNHLADAALRWQIHQEETHNELIAKAKPTLSVHLGDHMLRQLAFRDQIRRRVYPNVPHLRRSRFVRGAVVPRRRKRRRSTGKATLASQERAAREALLSDEERHRRKLLSNRATEALRSYMDKHYQRCIKLFHSFDTDHNGTIDQEEFLAGCKALRVPMSRGDLALAFDVLDGDGSGTVEYQELFTITRVTAVKEARKENLQDLKGRLRRMFESMDLDTSDGLTAFQIMKAIHRNKEVADSIATTPSLAQLLQPGTMAMVFADADADGDGLLTFDELWERAQKVRTSRLWDNSEARTTQGGSDSDSSGSDSEVDGKVAALRELLETVRRAIKEKMKSDFLRAVDVFRAFDTDKSGMVDEQELSEGMKRLGVQLTEGEACDIFAAFDGDGSGAVDYKELVQTFADPRSLATLARTTITKKDEAAAAAAEAAAELRKKNLNRNVNVGNRQPLYGVVERGLKTPSVVSSESRKKRTKTKAKKKKKHKMSIHPKPITRGGSALLKDPLSSARDGVNAAVSNTTDVGNVRSRRRRRGHKEQHLRESSLTNIADLLCKNFGLDDLTSQIDQEMSAAAATASKLGGGRGKRSAAAAAVPAATVSAAEDVAELYVKVHGKLPQG